MARPGYVSLYADERTQKIFDEFIATKGITKSTALTDMMTIYMLAKDSELYNELLQKSLNVGSVKEIIMQKEDSQPINDYIFMKLGTSHDVDGEPLTGTQTMEAYMRSIEEHGETWFSTMSLSTGMNKKKVNFYNDAIRSGETVKMFFAIGEGYNDIKYSATIKEIVSNRDETTCPGDASIIPPEFGEEETAKIWFHIVDLKEEDTMRASMLWFRQTGTNVKEAISNGQCHFGYVFIPDEE